MLAEVARQLGEVGLRVQVNAEDKIRFFDRLLARDSSFFLLGWACESGDSGDALDTLVHSPNRTLGRENYLDISDPGLDGLIDHANSALDRQERARWLREATARLAALHAIVPLTIQTEAVATSRRVTWTPPLDYALRLESFRPAAIAGQQP